MALVYGDRVLETSTTTGTGAFTLAAAVTGYQRFSSVCSVSDTCYYSIFAVDGNGNPSGDWETGLGTYSSANTLTRTTVEDSSNAGSAVNFAAGTKYVMISQIAAAIGAGGGGISSGTSFPGSPTTNDLFFRTDIGEFFQYDGTRWLSTNRMYIGLEHSDSLNFYAGSSNNDLRAAHPGNADQFAIYVEEIILYAHVTGTGTWSVNVRYDTAGTFTALDGTGGIAVANGDADRAYRLATNIVVPSSADGFGSQIAENSGTSNLYIDGLMLAARRIAT